MGRKVVQLGIIKSHQTYGQGVLDLHSMPSEVAKLAVRAAILDSLQGSPGAPGASGASDGPQLVFITGRGKHSIDGEALLRPAVLRVLREEFGLEGRVDLANPGRVSTTGRRLRRARLGDGADLCSPRGGLGVRTA